MADAARIYCAGLGNEAWGRTSLEHRGEG
jgi:hypothetical protein